MSRPLTVLFLGLNAICVAGCYFDASGRAGVGGADAAPDAGLPDPDAAVPPADYQTIEGEPGAYRVIAAPASLATASLDCADDGPWAHLVVIDRAAEGIAVRGHADEVLDGDRVWLGIDDRGVEGVWLTHDLQSVAYTHWKDGEPNDANDEDCAVVLGASDPPGHHGLWNDIDCDAPHAYLCEWGPVP